MRTTEFKRVLAAEVVSNFRSMLSRLATRGWPLSRLQRRRLTWVTCWWLTFSRARSARYSSVPLWMV